METVKRNAARYGESLAASGLTGDRESGGLSRRRDDDEEPPKKKSKKAKKRPAARKPAARKTAVVTAIRARGRGRGGAADTSPAGFC